MFKKLESILSTRFSQFQPRSLIEVLHACIHLERFPLNYVSKVFSPYFLQRLQGEVITFFSRIPPASQLYLYFGVFNVDLIIFPTVQGEPLNRNALGQLTQLYLSTSLECHYYRVGLCTTGRVPLKACQVKEVGNELCQ